MTKKITTESFSNLLEVLSSDKTEAGIAYAKLRDSLVRFFQLKGDFEPETAADETLDRVALKLSENGAIDDLTKYSFGVARFIFLERLKIKNKEKVAADGFYADRMQSNPFDETDDFLPFRWCFAKLADDEKTLLQQYFADLPYLKLIEHRERICEQQSLSVNNLRLKIFRLRQRLEDCVKRSLRK